MQQDNRIYKDSAESEIKRENKYLQRADGGHLNYPQELNM